MHTLKSFGLFIFGLLVLNFPVLAQVELTVGGHTFEQLAECYANNWISSNVRFSFIQLNDEDTRTYKVFLFEPLSIDVGKESFPNCSFLRFFCTSDIVHGVSAFVGVLKDNQYKYLMTDKQAEELLQTAGKPIETERDFKAFMMTFAQLRVYDIIYKNPIQKNPDPNTYQTYDRQYPDSEWGVFVHTSVSGALSGHVTVVLNPYTDVLRRYDFELTAEKRMKLVKTRELYCGNPIR